MNPTECLAFDRASVRTIDANGRLQISRTNISKANVNAYSGEKYQEAKSLDSNPTNFTGFGATRTSSGKQPKPSITSPCSASTSPIFPLTRPMNFVLA